MMTNRLKDRLGEPEEERPPGDYWEITGSAGWFTVSEETARRVLGLLRREVQPRWLRFNDLFGSEVSVLSRRVDCVRECGVGQRAAERRFNRDRRDERKADGRPWDDDELL